VWAGRFARPTVSTVALPRQENQLLEQLDVLLILEQRAAQFQHSVLADFSPENVAQRLGTV
jgi:hypothetical protein